MTRRKSAAKPGAPMPQMSERSEAAGPSNQEKVTHHYQALLDAQTRISELFNKTLITLGGGAVVLSVSLADKLHGPHGSHHGGVLLSAWLVLIVSLFLALLSLHLSKRATEYAVDAQDERAQKLNSWIGWTDYGSMGLLFGGLVLLVTFGWLNLEGTPHGNQENSYDSTGGEAQPQRSGIVSPAAQANREPAAIGANTAKGEEVMSDQQKPATPVEERSYRPPPAPSPSPTQAPQQSGSQPQALPEKPSGK